MVTTAAIMVGPRSAICYPRFASVTAHIGLAKRDWPRGHTQIMASAITFVVAAAKMVTAAAVMVGLRSAICCPRLAPVTAQIGQANNFTAAAINNYGRGQNLW